jgi:hypothetical protein
VGGVETSAGRAARLFAEQAATFRARAEEAQRKAEAFRLANRTERRVTHAVRTLEEFGWVCLEDRRWPGTRRGNVDLIAIGPGGVFVIDVKAWKGSVAIAGPRITCEDDDRTEDAEKVLAITDLVDPIVDELGMSANAVLPVMVLAGRSEKARRVADAQEALPFDGSLGRLTIVGERQLLPYLTGRGQRLGAEQIDLVATALHAAFPVYESAPAERWIPVALDPVLPRIPSQEPPSAEPLFDIEEVLESLGDAAKQPIEDWMVWLHPAQASLVRRQWNGPARIRGAAGTGKTVVALHRTAWLASTRPGPILFTSYVRTLPATLASLFARMSPELVGRVEFSGLHAWAAKLLADRGEKVRIKDPVTAFNRAWTQVGSGSVLARRAHRQYWHDEINHVIKGRGLTEFDHYLSLQRVGRRLALDADERAAVWDLYTRYAEILAGRGEHDYNDLLRLAWASLQAHPLEKPYAAVVIDEVQDLTLLGIHIAAELTGDRPDALLLVGDGQQSIYPGGFRLAEAGISIAGRSVVLRANYRNSSEILRAAQAAVAGTVSEDPEGDDDGGVGAVEVVRSGGLVGSVHAADQPSLQIALVENLRDASTSGFRFGDMAVLCETNHAASHWCRVLREAGIPVQPLRDYAGEPNGCVKVGTIKRAKGLDFAYVFLPGLRVETGPRYGESESVWRERQELEARERFVGMTRARDGLWLGFVSG